MAKTMSQSSQASKDWCHPPSGDQGEGKPSSLTRNPASIPSAVQSVGVNLRASVCPQHGYQPVRSAHCQKSWKPWRGTNSPNRKSQTLQFRSYRSSNPTFPFNTQIPVVPGHGRDPFWCSMNVLNKCCHPLKQVRQATQSIAEYASLNAIFFFFFFEKISFKYKWYYLRH